MGAVSFQKGENHYRIKGMRILFIKILQVRQWAVMDEEEIVKEPSKFPVYSKEFLMEPQAMLSHSHKMKKQLDDFLQAFSRRSDAELSYQKSLNECTKVLDKYIDASCEKSVSYICSAFKVDNEQRGSQAKELSESIKADILGPLTEASKSYGELIKISDKNLKKVNKDYTYLSDNYKRALENYKFNEIEGKELMVTKHIYRFTSEFPQDKKNKLIAKTTDAIKSKMGHEKLYQVAVNQYNEIIQIFRKESTETLNNLQRVEREILESERDAIRKLIVGQISMFKNVEYDLINISKQMEKISGETDIQAAKEEALQTLPDKILGDLSPKQIENNDHNLFIISLKNVEEDQSSWLINLKKNKILRKVLQARMKELLPSQASATAGQKMLDQSPHGKKKTVGDEQNNVGAGEGQQQEQKNAGEEQQQKSAGEEQQQKSAGEEQQQKSAGEEQQKQLAGKSLKQDEKTEGQGPTGEKEEEEKMEEEKNETCEKIWEQLPQDLFTLLKHPQVDRVESLADFRRATDIIHSLWMDGKVLGAPEKEELKEMLSKSHLMRVLVYLFIEEYRIGHMVLMKWSNYHQAGELIRVILDVCEKQGDVFTIKGLLGLVFTFYSIDNDKAKKLLYQTPPIRHCEVWRRDDFWEASIFESTFEEMAGFSLQKEETQAETLLREKNNIFSQLASFCHYMLMLGCTPKSVRRIVGKYCRLYEMTDEQNRDLSKMISNTIKQLKETKLLKAHA